jgi:nitrogen PTS system EIIA component
LAILEPIKIFRYLDPECIAFLDLSLRNEAIEALIDLLDRKGKLFDKQAFRKAIFDREELISTGIGMGVAVPHAKLSGFADFFIAIGIQQKRGLEWNAIDHAPVRFIFLIGGPDCRQTEYLQILSHLTSAIKEPDLRKTLLHATTAEEILHAFVQIC